MLQVFLYVSFKILQKFFTSLSSSEYQNENVFGNPHSHLGDTHHDLKPKSYITFARYKRIKYIFMIFGIVSSRAMAQKCARHAAAIVALNYSSYAV